MLVNEGTFNASKANHRELLRTDDTLVWAAEEHGSVLELVQLQLAYREAVNPHSGPGVNPPHGMVLAHRFGRLVREPAA